jgi:hypothetical protein
MALVILHTQTENALTPLHYEAFCAHCHKSLGRFDGDEVAHLINDVPLGSVLCYDCEEDRLHEILLEYPVPLLSPGVRLMLVEHGLV